MHYKSNSQIKSNIYFFYKFTLVLLILPYIYLLNIDIRLACKTCVERILVRLNLVYVKKHLIEKKKTKQKKVKKKLPDDVKSKHTERKDKRKIKQKIGKSYR